MKFQFKITVTEDDYLEFNKFTMLRSPQGAKNTKTGRIVIALICGIPALISLISGGFTADAFIGIIPYLILCACLQFFWKRYLIFSVKEHIKQLKNNGKLPYSSFSAIEFGEDSLVETTEDGSSEQKYSSLERICVVEDRCISFRQQRLGVYHTYKLL